MPASLQPLKQSITSLQPLKQSITSLQPLKQSITSLQPLKNENRNNIRRIKTSVCPYNDVIFNQSKPVYPLSILQYINPLFHFVIDIQIEEERDNDILQFISVYGGSITGDI